MNKLLLFTSKQNDFFISTESKGRKENQIISANLTEADKQILSSNNLYDDKKTENKIAINIGFNLCYNIIYH